MSTRNDRRKKKAEIKKKLRNPLVRRILKAQLARGSGTETFRLDDDGTGQPMFFNVSEMRAWAEENLEIFAMPPDFQRASRIIESGAIDLEHLQNYTIRHQPKPIIVARGLLDGDQIIDGAHRFVAFCSVAAEFGLDISLPGYVFEPCEWQPFVVPASVARACGFK